MRLPLSNQGARFAAGLWLLQGFIGAGSAVAAVAFAVRALTTTPSPCEAGTVGGLGLTAAFAGIAWLTGHDALPGWRAAARAREAPGFVTLERDRMVVVVPGLLSAPVSIEREWIDGVVELSRRESIHDNGRLSLSFATITTKVVFKQPIGLRSAVSVPQIPRMPVAGPPGPSTPVDGLVLDFVDPPAAVRHIREWLSASDGREDVPPPPGPAPPRSRGMATWLVPLALMIGGIATLLLDTPRGPECPQARTDASVTMVVLPASTAAVGPFGTLDPATHTLTVELEVTPAASASVVSVYFVEALGSGGARWPILPHGGAGQCAIAAGVARCTVTPELVGPLPDRWVLVADGAHVDTRIEVDLRWEPDVG